MRNKRVRDKCDIWWRIRAFVFFLTTVDCVSVSVTHTCHTSLWQVPATPFITELDYTQKNTPREARNERRATRLSLSTAAASEDHGQTLRTTASSLSIARWLTEPRLAPSAYGSRPFAAQESRLHCVFSDLTPVQTHITWSGSWHKPTSRIPQRFLYFAWMIYIAAFCLRFSDVVVWVMNDTMLFHCADLHLLMWLMKHYFCCYCFAICTNLTVAFIAVIFTLLLLLFSLVTYHFLQIGLST